MNPRIEKALAAGTIARLRPRCECTGCEAHDSARCYDTAQYVHQVRMLVNGLPGTGPRAICALCANAMLFEKEIETT